MKLNESCVEEFEGKWARVRGVVVALAMVVVVAEAAGGGRVVFMGGRWGEGKHGRIFMGGVWRG